VSDGSERTFVRATLGGDGTADRSSVSDAESLDVSQSSPRVSSCSWDVRIIAFGASTAPALTRYLDLDDASNGSSAMCANLLGVHFRGFTEHVHLVISYAYMSRLRTVVIQTSSSCGQE
jgi:hypothetical protein